MKNASGISVTALSVAMLMGSCHSTRTVTTSSRLSDSVGTRMEESLIDIKNGTLEEATTTEITLLSDSAILPSKGGRIYSMKWTKTRHYTANAHREAKSAFVRHRVELEQQEKHLAQSKPGKGPHRWLMTLGIAALIIVFYQIINRISKLWKITGH